MAGDKDMSKYPKPGAVGRPRICAPYIEWIRELHQEGRSYAWIAWKTGISPKTCQRYCTGKWRRFTPE
jgi:hypothetical protein